MKDLESCRQLFTFSLEVTAVDASENYVVAGGSDFTVKKINLKTHEQYDRVDTNGEILCVAIDPSEQVYAVACCDGTVSIYNLLDNEKLSTHEHMFSAFGDLNVESARHAMSWSKDGSELYVPSQGSVKVIKRDGWTLGTDSFKGDATATVRIFFVFDKTSLQSFHRFL
ncbi:unnamed protein product [Cylicostephanus goldi]|uniref:Anaphase-promoting complex subunit 4 WD40 domain-containing protein n=1 Tax=Cylicostephanus goldi TaxID=71465 RepID=A0A3P7QYJ8_CYLGO|nr:unnamed protein product [Cylicostephanus goldi]